MMKGKECLIVALDGMGPEDAINLAEAIGPGELAGFKANSLLDHCLIDGFSLRELVRSLGKIAPIFWADQKFSDVKQTVYDRIVPYRKSGVNLITVMAEEGVPMIREAIKAGGAEIGIIGVTVLTDKDEMSFPLDSGGTIQSRVLQYARNIVLAGGTRIVCSAEDLVFLEKYPELECLESYTPGIRPLWAPPKGQVRFTTPTQALQKGADYLVVGSPIYNPPEKIGGPVAAVQKIVEEIESVEDK